MPNHNSKTAHRDSRVVMTAVALTLAAIVGRELLPPRRLDLLAPAAHVDRYPLMATTPRGSTAAWKDPASTTVLCRVMAGDDQASCGVGFTLARNGNGGRGMDLRNFDTLELDLGYDGPGRNLRVSMRDFDARFSRLDDANSGRFQSVQLRVRDLARPLAIPLDELTVPEWWMAQFDLPREDYIAGRENVIAFSFDLLGRPDAAEHSMRLRRFVLRGEWVRRDTLYLGVLCFWMAIASLGVLVVQLRLRQSQRAQARVVEESETLRRLSTIDPLTGVLNRRGIEGALVNRAAGIAETAVLLVDIDHFKQVNDVHGHATGDEVLRRVAGAISAAVRSSDTVGRWGGEEFLVVSAYCPPQHAVRLAEKIRAHIAAATTEEPGALPVTASVGVAMLARADDFEEGFQRADAALYRAKAAGRDRVAIDGDDAPA
jgi:diguanylate cyclase (GGDEF)-like protein